MVAGGLAVAGIKFDSGPITQGRTIGITVGAFSTVDPSISRLKYVRDCQLGNYDELYVYDKPWTRVFSGDNKLLGARHRFRRALRNRS